jgi:chromosome segregation ATPase
LTQLEQEAAEEGDGLAGACEEFESALDTTDETRGEVGGLRDAAAGTRDAIAAAGERLEQAIAGVLERLQGASDDTAEAHARLDDGFEAAWQALEDLQQELESANQETAEVTGELVATLERLQSETDTAWDATEGALDEAATDVEGLESLVEARAADGVTALGTEAEGVETACTSLDGDLATIYAGLTEGVDTERETSLEAIEAAAEEAGRVVAASEREDLEGPADALESEALAPLGAEWARLSAVLAGATTLADALPPLAGDLEKCRAIVGRLDELLETLTE